MLPRLSGALGGHIAGSMCALPASQLRAVTALWPSRFYKEDGLRSAETEANHRASRFLLLRGIKA
jgi:hypothetical protein